MKIKIILQSQFGALICNLLISFLLLFVARIVFIAYNFDYYSDNLDSSLLFNIMKGGMRFDLTALFYINALYILLYSIPLHYKNNKTYYKILKYIYIIFNSVCLFVNLADTVYFRYTGRRTTASIFSEFKNEDNLIKIFGVEFIHSFVLVIVFALLMFLLIKLYRTPYINNSINKMQYYIKHSSMLIVFILLSVVSIRGGFTRATRPITLSNANEYVNRPVEAAAVLNTPFSLIRTIGKSSFNMKPYMSNNEALKYFNPVHLPDSVGVFHKKNVVIFIVESLSRGFIGALNKDITGFKGYTPFLDSIINESVSFKYAFANGRKSIDAMPSILSSIPMMEEPFILTEASMNKYTGIAGLLKEKGYVSAFFHGAPNGSMGFNAFAKSVGYDQYVGMDEYCKSPKHKGMNDFDGSWAIWDYPFFQFFEEEISKYNQPFVATIFSASSHHPFAMQDEFKYKFKDEGKSPILKCVRYVDESLRMFFEKARHEKWYNNTIFVIVADHSNAPIMSEYETDQGVFGVPIIFYEPGNEVLRGMSDKVAQQIDIMPTLLNYLGYDKPYVAFGKDLFGSEDSFAFSYMSGIYQLTNDRYFMQFDGTKVRAIYEYKKDRLLKHNILKNVPTHTICEMENKMKSFVQQYCDRMKNDKLMTIE